MIRERAQGFAFSALAVIGAILPTRGDTIVAIIFILLFGVPHGAFDPLYAARLYRPRGYGHWLVLALLYVLAASFMVGLWILAPVTFLSVFLLLSAAHFSGDPSRGTEAVTRLLYGGAIIVLPTWWHGAEVTRILEVLIGTAGATSYVGALRGLAPAWALGLGLAVLRSLRRDRWAALELAAPGLLALSAQPLVAFTIFFCAMHGARHSLRTLRLFDLAADRQVMRTMARSMFGLLPFLALGWYLLAGVSLEARVLQLLFIGLAALTVPHMALVERLRFAREPLAARHPQSAQP